MAPLCTRHGVMLLSAVVCAAVVLCAPVTAAVVLERGVAHDAAPDLATASASGFDYATWTQLLQEYVHPGVLQGVDDNVSGVCGAVECSVVLMQAPRARVRALLTRCACAAVCRLWTTPASPLTSACRMC